MPNKFISQGLQRLLLLSNYNQMIDGIIQVRSLTKCQEFQLARILCRPGPRILLSRLDQSNPIQHYSKFTLSLDTSTLLTLQAMDAL